MSRTPLALAIAVVAGCTPRPTPPPTTPSAVGTATAECRGATVAISPATDEDLRTGTWATLRASFAGDGMGTDAEWTCLDDGIHRTSTHGPITARIHASADQLQRIRVHDGAILMSVRPGGEVDIDYHPCMNWTLTALWLDSESVIDTPDAVAVERSAACPPGFVEGGELRSAADPRCRDAAGECAWRRCVRASTIEVDDPTVAAGLHFVDSLDGTRIDPPIVAGTPIELAPHGDFCAGFANLATWTEIVQLAPGVGERWTLRAGDDGRLYGEYRSD